MKTHSELSHFGGLDWAKHHHDICILEPQGQIVERLRFEHNQSLQPTPVGRLSSAFAVDITRPAWLSSGR